MKMEDFYALFVVSVIATCTLVILSGCSPQPKYDWGSLASGVGQVERRP